MVAPYKRTGLMVRGFDGPRGFALEEGIRTSNQLASSLDRMTSFFFQQASQQRTIEGQEYGAANAPTIEQLREATETGEDPFNYAPTVFGRNARQAALAQVENEIIVDAAKRFDGLVYEAGRTLVSPKVLQQDLDSAIGGYTEILEATSPALARKMNAKLSMNANTLFDAYRKRYLKSVTASATTTSNEAVSVSLNDDIRNFEQFLKDSPLSEDLIAERIARLQSDHRARLLSAGYKPNKTPIQTALKNHLTGLQTATENFIITAVIENGLNISDITQAIGGGADAIEIPTNSTSDLIKVNGILPYLNNDQKKNVAQQIRNSVNGQSDLEESEIRAKETEDTVLNRTRVKEIANLFEQLPNEDNVEEIRLKIKQIRNSQDPQANTIADSLEEELLATGGGRANSELGIKEDFEEKIISGVGSYPELAEIRSKLSKADYRELSGKLAAEENKELKLALEAVAVELNVNPGNFSIPPQSTAQAENRLIYKQANKEFKEILQKAQEGMATGEVIDFDGKKLAEDFINNKIAQRQSEAFSKARSTFVKKLNSSKMIVEGGLDFPDNIMGSEVVEALTNVRDTESVSLDNLFKIKSWLETAELNDWYKSTSFEEIGPTMLRKIKIMIDMQAQP
tara:strand:- start:2644 stop:4527 length:1884 start_codon:yes stop_codon:yes gene_type:complete